MQSRWFRGRRSMWMLVLVPALALAGLPMTTASQAAPPSHTRWVQPKPVNNLDCNAWSPRYGSVNPSHRMDCTDPRGPESYGGYDTSPAYSGDRGRFLDNGHYVGHDEPSVKFISHAAGTANTMTYLMKLPRDPKRRPTPSGSVTTYAELSPAPWFGLPICDPRSYPQNPCTPHSDSNSGLLSDPNAAGSAFMELQLYPPGFTPFPDNTSCSRTKWCSAMSIDSLESKFNFADLNADCEEPVNFAFLQRNGVPTGPPSPQLADASTELPNAQTLMMNPGDVLALAITDPLSGRDAGFTATVTDLTTHQKGFMIASARNGFMNTNYKTCAGTPHTFHAEYNTARQRNQVPWAALEGGVLMEQETGHSEACNSVANKDPFVETFGNGQSYVDSKVFDTCIGGGSEGRHEVGEGPCNLKTLICTNATTEGRTGPAACPSDSLASGQLCEFADGFCFKAGTRTVVINGVATTQSVPLAWCGDNRFQNGDLDFDGIPYQRGTWPNGSRDHPTSIRYVGPFGPNGKPYSRIQFESDIPGSEFLCNVETGKRCDVPPLGAKFYPYWTMTNRQPLMRNLFPPHACVWNFGDTIPHVTTQNFGKDAQYGAPNLARYGGTSTSPVMANPEFSGNCPAFNIEG